MPPAAVRLCCAESGQEGMGTLKDCQNAPHPFLFLNFTGMGIFWPVNQVSRDANLKISHHISKSCTKSKCLNPVFSSKYNSDLRMKREQVWRSCHTETQSLGQMLFCPTWLKQRLQLPSQGNLSQLLGLFLFYFWGGGEETQSSPPGRNVSLTLRKSARCFKTPMRTSSKSLRNPSNTGSRSRWVISSPSISAISWIEKASVRRTFH